jgi:hypothetical protein
MRGILTNDDVRQNIVFISYDSDAGQLVVRRKDDEELISGVEGHLLGFNRHNLPFKDKIYPKLDIFLENEGVTFQVQLGLTSWFALHVMNALLSMNGDVGGILRIVCYQKDKVNKSYITYNGQRLEWKYKPEVMNLPEEKTAKEAKRDSICINMFNILFKKYPYELPVTAPAKTKVVNAPVFEDEDPGVEIPF